MGEISKKHKRNLFVKYLKSIGATNKNGLWSSNKTVEINKNFVHDGELVQKFETVYNSVHAFDCNLTTLKNFPNRIDGNLLLKRNKITCFDNTCTIKLSENSMLDISDNRLTSLENCPKIMHSLTIDLNNLKSLKGAPKLTSNLKIYRLFNIEDVELEWYNTYNNTDDVYNRDESLLRYISKEFTDDDAFKDVINKIVWPENFITNSENLIKSLRSVNKFNL